jgi:hypothetical protein
MNPESTRPVDPLNRLRFIVCAVAFLAFAIGGSMLFVDLRSQEVIRTIEWTAFFVVVGFAGALLFTLIDPASQQSFGLRAIVNFTGGAAIGAGFMFLAHWLALRPPVEEVVVLPGEHTIVCLDSPFPNNVYDDFRRKIGGTNADGIKSILATVHDSVISAVRCTPTWADQDLVRQQEPDVIVMHYSTFRDRDSANDYEGLLHQNLAQLAESRNTRFIVYSRQFLRDDAPQDLEPLVAAVPALEGRVHTFAVPTLTFTDPAIALKLKNLVENVLEG